MKVVSVVVSFFVKMLPLLGKSAIKNLLFLYFILGNLIIDKTF